MKRKGIPKRLGEKLRAIREYKGWTLDQMAEAVGRAEASRRARVYEWEAGLRQPDLPTLLAYARLVGISTDVLIDDNLDLELEGEGSGAGRNRASERRSSR